MVLTIWSTHVSIMELSCREKVKDWVISIIGFEKILTQANSKAKQG